jgi:flagellar basal body-associated protein FliL
MAASESKEPNTKSPEEQPKKKSTGKVILICLLALLLAVLPAYGVWYWQQNEAKQQQEQLQEKIDELQKAKEKLEKAAKELSTKAADTCPAGLTEAQTENVQASIESMNTAALDQLMTDTVEVTFAASEKGGNVTKSQAIADLAYLNSATMPWNWNIDQATLNSYKNGDYNIYLADDDIFGVAANKYFVSFRVKCGKIDQVFVSASSDLL